jgi:hypothetical protein
VTLEAAETEVSVKLDDDKVAAETVVSPTVRYVGSRVGNTVGALLGEADGSGDGALAL